MRYYGVKNDQHDELELCKYLKLNYNSPIGKSTVEKYLKDIEWMDSLGIW